jgi:hypothetical protein
MRYIPLLLLLSACATLTADSDQRIAIALEPEMKAECTATSKEGSWVLKEAPGEITVARAFVPLLIQCETGEYTGKATLEASTRGRAYGNILLGGVPAYVDAGTGAGYEYPAKIVIRMEKIVPKK